MPRLVGLGYASKLYRELPGLQHLETFSKQGNEVAFGTIGNASCAEGVFWEAVNAICLLQLPVVLSIWDDGYGISVPNEFQLAKGHLSAILAGFQRRPDANQGCELLEIKGWDYPALCDAYSRAATLARRQHVPVILHITELTQPQGHSTSGSHERYKSTDRLAWEKELDCLLQMRLWMIESGVASEKELAEAETEDRKLVSEAKDRAWKASRVQAEIDSSEVLELLARLSGASSQAERVEGIIARLERTPNASLKDLLSAAREVLIMTRREKLPEVDALVAWQKSKRLEGLETYGSELYCETSRSALEVEEVEAVFVDDAVKVNGYEILNAGFDSIFRRFPEVVAFGEDVGALGDVNQGMAGLQERFGTQRISDTGIRECTIMGQAIGIAMRGLRPIAEIQYLDYLLYGLQILSDDLSSLRYRTCGGQMSPVIIRTRGHRLEGIWHSGSPMASILHLLRGMYVCVPRDMTRAMGFYNTLLQGDDPALVVEVLNAYRSKETLPANLEDLRLPLGIPEVLREGGDLTVVTYGACCRIALAAAEQLSEVGIEAEIIDVQTLMPFDRHSMIVDSIEKTSRVLFLDEDVPGGATSFMMQQVLEKQGGFWHLDSRPRTVTAAAHRPPYGSDGDYFSKPSREDVFATAYEIFHEEDPETYPRFF